MLYFRNDMLLRQMGEKWIGTGEGTGGGVEKSKIEYNFAKWRMAEMAWLVGSQSS